MPPACFSVITVADGLVINVTTLLNCRSLGLTSRLPRSAAIRESAGLCTGIARPANPGRAHRVRRGRDTQSVHIGETDNGHDDASRRSADRA